MKPVSFFLVQQTIKARLEIYEMIQGESGYEKAKQNKTMPSGDTYWNQAVMWDGQALSVLMKKCTADLSHFMDGIALQDSEGW